MNNKTIYNKQYLDEINKTPHTIRYFKENILYKQAFNKFVDAKQNSASYIKLIKTYLDNPDENCVYLSNLTKNLKQQNNDIYVEKEKLNSELLYKQS